MTAFRWFWLSFAILLVWQVGLLISGNHLTEPPKYVGMVQITSVSPIVLLRAKGTGLFG